MLLLALTNFLTLTAAKLSSSEEGHTRAFTVAKPTDAPTVPHYLGNGVVAHAPASANGNITWMDIHSDNYNSKRSSNCNGIDCAGVYICSEKGFKGNCYWQQAGGGECHSYLYTRDSSFGVDMNLQCGLFAGGSCLGDQYTGITWPGLGAGGLWGMYTWWNGEANSFKCRHCVGCIYGNAPGWTVN